MVAHSGTLTSDMSFLVTQEKAARGTDVTIVGTRASCQPVPNEAKGKGEHRIGRGEGEGGY